MADHVPLVDLPNAALIPNVPTAWTSLCWAVFFAGVGILLFALASLGGFGPDPKCMIHWVYSLLPVAFVLAAANTFASATQYNKRQQEIVAWLRDLMQWRSTQTERHARDNECGDESNLGLLKLYHRSDKSNDDPLRIWAAGVYAPQDYWSQSKGEEFLFPLTGYIALLRAETHSARTTCAKLAAALGGVFVTGIQVYGRLAQQIADAAS